MTSDVATIARINPGPGSLRFDRLILATYIITLTTSAIPIIAHLLPQIPARVTLIRCPAPSFSF